MIVGIARIARLCLTFFVLIAAAGAIGQTPSLQGTASVQTSGATVVISAEVDYACPSGYSGTSGTLRVELWATSSPYSGGGISGYQTATYQLGQRACNTSLSFSSGSIPYTAPPAGYSSFTLLLTEYDGGQFYIVDYVSLNSGGNTNGNLVDLHCNLNVVTLKFWDSATQDNDRVTVTLGSEVLASNFDLNQCGGPNEPTSGACVFTRTLPANSAVAFKVLALDEGSISPNTAALKVLGGCTPEQQEWRLNAGQTGQITIYTGSGGGTTPTFTFSGTVVDGSTNQPVGGAQVYFVANGSTFSTNTDGTGRFSLTFNTANVPSNLAYWVTRTGYVPLASNLALSGAGADVGTLGLEALNGNIVLLEVVPDLHHLGDNSYSGSANSQFQKGQTEGTTFSRTFTVTAAQRASSGATLTLLAKGLECNNTMTINGALVANLNSSPSNGSFGKLTFQVSMSSFVVGSNTLSIQSSTSGCSSVGDYDDFEFTNGVIRFSGGPVGDTQAPTVPANLTASAVSGNQINLAWMASSDNLGVTAYKLYRNGGLLSTLGNVTSASDTGVSPSTTYTYTVSACDGAGNCSAQSAAASATTPGPQAGQGQELVDFNDDGKSDLLWRHFDGSTYLWQMNGTSQAAASPLLGAGSGWRVIDTGDFDGDGKSDLLWEHADGRVYVWLMNGTTLVQAGLLMGVGTGWSVVEVGDFNGDGKSDLLWQHTDGRTTVWLMSGASYTNYAQLMGAGTGWSVVEAGDFNGDGKTDLIWRHFDGRTNIWLMNGTSYISYAQLIGAGTGWSVTQVGDFNGDGRTDLVWQHIDGRTNIWLMNGTAYTSYASLMGAGTGWSVVEVGDFNGDGKADLVWQNTDGSTSVWLMNGTSYASYALLMGAGTGWSVVQVGDFNGDGKTDLIWRHTNGQINVWLMNGTTYTSYAPLMGPGTGWIPGP